ncbi:MAG: hypothetical protein QG654_497 [Patescibacteria group bacterium]|jgi:GNAT superfamily N-acetyltransferase|nr:hypothetical protein [Patescibacteria group bacterium]
MEFLKSKNEKTPQRFIFENISIDQVSDNAIKFFEGASQRFILPEEYYPGNFEGLFLLKHENGDITYVATQIKFDEYNTYFFDTRDGEEIGHGELRFAKDSEDEFFKDKPFVGFTDTEENFRRQGLGERRLLEMGAYSRQIYNLPIYSDTLISENAKALWNKFVSLGMAEVFIENSGGRSHERYVLLV